MWSSKWSKPFNNQISLSLHTESEQNVGRIDEPLDDFIKNFIEGFASI